MDFMNYMEENPMATMAGLGALKSFLNQPKERAAAQAQIAQTQWSPFLGIRPGDPMSVKQSSPFEAAVRGATAGYAKKKNDEYNQKVLDAIEDKASPYKKPSKPVAEPDVATSEYTPMQKPKENNEVPLYLQRPDYTNTSVYNYNPYKSGENIMTDIFMNSVTPGNWNQATSQMKVREDENKANQMEMHLSPYLRRR